MKQVLLLYRFNPYHNRIVKKFDTTAEYIAAAGAYLSPEWPKNFSYRDGVTTSMRVKLDTVMETPDYLLILSDSTTPTIESRWFIMDAEITSGTLCTLGLRRDVIAEYYDDVINAPAFIEKATLSPSDPFIFNAENITVNKIKKGETLLQDSSKCAWVVGYLASNVTTTTVTSQEAVEVSSSYSDAADYISHFPKKNYVYFDANSEELPTTITENENVFQDVDVSFHMTRTNYVGASGFKPYGVVGYKVDSSGVVSDAAYQTFETTSEMQQSTGTPYAPFKTNINGIWGTIVNNRIYNDLDAVASDFVDGVCDYYNYSREVTELAPYINQKIKIGNSYYQLQLEGGSVGGDHDYFGTDESYDLVDALKNMSCWTSVDSVSASAETIELMAVYQYYRLHAVKITSAELTFEINSTKSEATASKSL